MNKLRRLSTIQALTAAALFGASAPIAKLLLGQVQPITLAALLYLGSGSGLLLIRAGSIFRARTASGEAPLTAPDWPWVLGALLAGGVFAPILLLISLSSTPAATASLLLNFEGVATTLVAAVVFREAVGPRIWLSVACVTVACIILTWSAEGGWGMAWGALGVMGACALWGIDNNLTRNVSGKNPLDVVLIKGLGAGAISLVLALALGQSLPAVLTVLTCLLLGFFSYGLSTMLFVRALRGLGAARTSALYATAPFVGVVIAFAVFQQLPGINFLIALPLMIFGAFLLTAEQHEHLHRHVADSHAHSVQPDSPHINAEGRETALVEHSHAPLEHSHPHAPDIHHRHDHKDSNTD